MGFYLKKTFKVGPINLNLSKSGLGVSAGVKGLRVSSGPRGNYINAGRGGFYYRKKLSSSPSPQTAPATLPTAQNKRITLWPIIVMAIILLCIILAHK